MEAATLQKKKTISKGKLKKTIKNVLCRPDPVFWPTILKDQANDLETALNKYKIDLPEYVKPHWKELKLIPKEKRPKPPKIKKVDGLLFGLLECSSAIQNVECSAVIIEALVNPRTIVQPVIEACNTAKVPVICLDGLRKLTLDNFGIPTRCLGVKTGYLIDLRNKILEVAKCNARQEIIKPEIMEVDEEVKIEKTLDVKNNLNSQCPYLYRTNKKSRVFIPSKGKGITTKNVFTGQDFIELSDKQKADSKAYMKMIVRRITNNANRAKIK